MTSDRARLTAAFRALRKRGFIALADVGGTRSDGWTAVTEAAANDDVPAVFWTEEAAAGRFAGARLVEALHLQWRGDSRTIVSVLRAHGLRVTKPVDERDTIDVLGAAGQGRVKKPAKVRTSTPKRDVTDPGPMKPALAAIVQNLEAALDDLKKKKWHVHFNASIKRTEQFKVQLVGVRANSWFDLRALSRKPGKVDLYVFGKIEDVFAACTRRGVPARRIGSSNVLSVWLGAPR